jgi:hypothetical protein
MAKQRQGSLILARGLVSHLATVDQTEVCPLSRGVMFQLLSRPLQPDIRFFRHPIPARPTTFLAVRLPAMFRRQPYGLTTFPACHTTDLGSASPPAVHRRRNLSFEQVIRPHTVWLMPVSSFGTTILTRFISSSLTLTVSASLRSQPLRCWEYPDAYLTVNTCRDIARPIVRRASHPTVTSDACLPRLLLVVQQVHSLT